MTGQFPWKWSKWLAQAEWWYNTSYHTTLNMSPFQVLYGYVPTHLGIRNQGLITTDGVNDLLEERQQMHESIKHHLQVAANSLKESFKWEIGYIYI